MKTVHYINHFLSDDENSKYHGNIPGNLKTNYIINKIIDIGFNVEVLSLCLSKQKVIFKLPTKRQLNNHFTLRHIASFPYNNIFMKIINLFLFYIQIVLYYFFRVKKGETLIIYHSVNLTKIITLLQKIKKINIIIEIEEIYGFAADGNKKYLHSEIKSLKKFDNYLLVNDLMSKTLNIENKNYFISYGVFNYRNGKKAIDDSGKINLVYAGTIERKKRGAFNAVLCAKYLPSNYVVNILGFGKPDVIDELNSLIEQNNYDMSNAKVVYHGLMTSDDLSIFLNQCHIGLSTNILRDEFVKNTFPSKVVTYMSHNLAIVIGYNTVFEDAKISKNWSYYKNNDPKDIARAVLNVNINENIDNSELIWKMDKDHEKWLLETITRVIK